MYIYPWHTDPTPSSNQAQISGKPLHHISSYIAECTYTHGILTPPPPPIKHRSLENHYIKPVSYIAECTYTHGTLTPPPPPIKHRSLENHYTK